MKKYAIPGLNTHFPVELLTPEEMGNADHLAATLNREDSFKLMERAGQAIADIVLNDYRQCRTIAVLCGPGNNGGDGYMAAHILKSHGFEPTIFALGTPRAGSDAEKAAALWGAKHLAFDNFSSPQDFDVVIDALYGAGLDRPLEQSLQEKLKRLNESGIPVIAVDLPSGVFGQNGAIKGEAVKASTTVTFFRLKPGHVCYPGRLQCGEIRLADIGIPEKVLETIKPTRFINFPSLWLKNWPELDYDTHKYRRGHAVVFSGHQSSTGAARLAAHAAARSGAGLVTIVSPEDALLVHEMHLTSIMLKEMGSDTEILDFLENRKVRSVILGPAFGSLERALSIIKVVLLKSKIFTLVLDADALTAMAGKGEEIFALIKQSPVNVILTPHEGEFQRVFPSVAHMEDLSRIEKAAKAATVSGSVVVYKGADTIIASPDGRLAVNVNGTPFLATAGAGDVLSGIIGGLSAQKMLPFEAACAGAFLHARCAEHFGHGMIAEDIVSAIPLVLSEAIM
ncbi:yjeF C-terminal region, hydroxyethylthiazole kinase-related/yjeF N-terminal region [Bartonella apis]|uniref:Bifunctional NAD(P)H-hydrate repair enzyme n=2 Tax=Bartonella apis TaxID=1686310 RepID=A0A1R0F6S1_9HYPH|nr:yjeF C-terminal region, hydroxyethylthiazole kinase-related/yjeF N-terminal region [Bartonella apis]OLY47333.1 yjeF C-terminal region, hydroxyethylthiazole kinase-related/yjeF N-terminal region [Bartonella apis]